MQDQWLYGTVEWVWTEGRFRINLPGSAEKFQGGSYQEVVEILSEFGMQGWEVVTCIGGGDWVYWTLKRKVFS